MECGGGGGGGDDADADDDVDDGDGDGDDDAAAAGDDADDDDDDDGDCDGDAENFFAKWWKLMKGLCCGSQADSAMRSTMKQKSTTMKIWTIKQLKQQKLKNRN